MSDSAGERHGPAHGLRGGRAIAATLAVIAAALAALLIYRAHRMLSADNALLAVAAVVDVMNRHAASIPDGRVEPRGPAWTQLSLPHGFTREARITTPWDTELLMARAGGTAIVDLVRPPPQMCVALLLGAASVAGVTRVGVNTMAADERPARIDPVVADGDCRKTVEVIRFIAALGAADTKR